jgi:hypothetical protein
LKYTKFMLVAYDGEPTGPLPFGDDCFHCEVATQGESLTQDQFITRYIDPAAMVVFRAAIPPMPSAMDMQAFMDWEAIYFGRSQDLPALYAALKADIERDERH